MNFDFDQSVQDFLIARMNARGARKEYWDFIGEERPIWMPATGTVKEPKMAARYPSYEEYVKAKEEQKAYLECSQSLQTKARGDYIHASHVAKRIASLLYQGVIIQSGHYAVRWTKHDNGIGSRQYLTVLDLSINDTPIEQLSFDHPAIFEIRER